MSMEPTVEGWEWVMGHGDGIAVRGLLAVNSHGTWYRTRGSLAWGRETCGSRWSW